MTKSSSENDQPIQVNRVTIAVNNIVQCRDFYSAVLGIPFEPVQMQEFRLYSANRSGFELLLCPRQLAQVATNIRQNTLQVRFVVPNVNSALEQGLKLGGTEISAPQRIENKLHVGLRDPDGNSIELMES